MDFTAFLERVGSERLRAVAEHWDQARGAARMPSFNQLRPAAIAAQLPIIWIYSYDRASDRFTGRLAGDRITQGYGRNFRGMPLAQLHPPHLLEQSRDRMRRVLLEPCCSHYAGRLFRRASGFGVGERIMLPLSDDSVMGASDYVLKEPDSQIFKAGLAAGVVEIIGDDTAWFGLDR